MQKKVTALDVAKIAGVSPATVSMILNKKNNVSFTKSTINNVEDAAKMLGYKVPANKKKEIGKKEKIIVVVVSNMTNPYYLMLLQGAETYAAEQGYSIFLCNIYHEEKTEEHYLKIISNMRISGIIYMCNPSQKCMKLLKIMVRKIPVVIVNNKEKEVNIDSIEIDNNKLGRVMAEHLLTLGHKYVGYIATSLKNDQKQRCRCVEGFVETFQNADKDNYVIYK